MLSLSQREKTLLKILITFILIVFIYFLIISPIIDFINSSDEEMSDNIGNLNKLDRIYNEYMEISEKKSRYLKQLNKKNENITSLIEQWANSTNIASNIAYTRRTQSNIQNKYIRITTNVKFDGVAIQPLLKFIYEVENSGKLLKINYLRIYQGLKGTNTYDVILKIDSFTMK
ncbi:MAG: type II secretion system protein GspM [Spirochaetota bacterium]|nr:type II secretion system protein GspM [Spirochaetota bacterium]